MNSQRLLTWILLATLASCSRVDSTSSDPSDLASGEEVAVSEGVYGPIMPPSVEARPIAPGPDFEGEAVLVPVSITTTSKPFSSEAAPGVRLQIGLASAFDSHSKTFRDPRDLVEVVTDGEGRARVELAVPRTWLEACWERQRGEDSVRKSTWPQGSEGPWVFAHASEPGRKKLFARRPIEETDPGAGIALRVKVRPGLTLVGHLLGRDGTSLALPPYGATVQMFGPEGKRVLERSSAGPAGEFRVHFEGGERVQVGAAVSGIGSARSAVLSLLPGRDPAPVLLTLRGDATLSGRLTRPDGTAIPFHRVMAQTSHPDGPPLRLGTIRAEIPPDGLRQGSTDTDGEGRFQIEGLAAGLYDVGVYRGYAQDYELLARELATGSSHELTCASYTLSVGVRDAEGRRLHPGVCDGGLVRIPPKDEVLLFCEALDPTGRATLDAWVSSRAARMTSGRVRFEVQPDQSYVVGIHSPIYRTASRVVFVGPRFEENVELRLDGPWEPATVLAQIELEGDAPSRDTQLQVVLPDTGVVIHELFQTDERSLPDLLLAPGRYELRASEEVGYGTEGHVYRPSRFADGRVFFNASPGDREEIDLALPRGSWLSVRIKLPLGWVPDPALSTEELTEGSSLEEVRQRAGGARVLLVDSKGLEWRPRFQLRKAELPIRNSSNSAYHASWIQPGIALESTVSFPEGSYQLRVEAPSCLPHEETIELRARETTALDIRLQSR